MRFISDNRVVEADTSVKLKVIAAGLPRCATSSLQSALENHLRLEPCMHMAHIAPHVDRLKTCYAAMNTTDDATRQSHVASLFAGYVASCDFPGMMFVDEILTLNPGCKIILNKRASAEAWLQSAQDTVAFFATWKYHAMTYLIPTDFWHWMIHQAASTVMMRRLDVPNIWCVESYAKHNDYIRGLAKKHDAPILEWEPQDGWGPICGFLGVPVPEVPFPHTNDRAFMKKLTVFLCVRGLLTWGAVLAAPVAVAWAWGRVW